MLIMVDLNEHSQCHPQVLVRNIGVGVISYSGLALKVITAGHGIKHRSSLPVKAYPEYYELIKRDNSLFDDDSGLTFSFE